MNDLALKIAWQAHSGQKRKGTDIPYIIHPIEVAVILIENGAEEDVVTSGILHDTLEDTSTTIDFIIENFGSHVAEIVKGASEIEKIATNTRLTSEAKVDSWKRRKMHTIEYLKNAPYEVKLVACADKLSNIRSMMNEYTLIGNKLWDKFNAGCKEQKWYYENLIKSLEDLSNYDMYKELATSFRNLFERTEVIDYINNKHND